MNEKLDNQTKLPYNKNMKKLLILFVVMLNVFAPAPENLLLSPDNDCSTTSKIVLLKYFDANLAPKKIFVRQYELKIVEEDVFFLVHENLLTGKIAKKDMELALANEAKIIFRNAFTKSFISVKISADMFRKECIVFGDISEICDVAQAISNVKYVEGKGFSQLMLVPKINSREIISSLSFAADLDQLPVPSYLKRGGQTKRVMPKQ